MYKLNLIADLVEERLIKGNFRWLANFNEIREDYNIGEFKIPVYASGGLEEKGFLLSRIFSAFVTPKYKVHFIFCAASAFSVKLLRKLVTSCKNKFEGEDWIFIGLIQSPPFDDTLKDAIENIADNRVGISAYSVDSKAAVSSKNVLGKALLKQLKSTYSLALKAEVASQKTSENPIAELLKSSEAKFDAFDLPNYIKSFFIMFALSTLFLISVAIFGKAPIAIQPATLLLAAIFSLLVGYRVYKTRYHATLTIAEDGFKLREGKRTTNGKWYEFGDVTLHITSKQEKCLRLYSGKTHVDLPISRTGAPVKIAYGAVKKLIEEK